MINKIIIGIFKVVIHFVSLLLSPIDNLITSSLPSLSNALGFVNNLIDYIISVIGYVVDCSCISDTAIALIITYFSFSLVVPLAVYTIKLAVRWYNALKP